MAKLHISASLQMVNDKGSVLLTPQSPARGVKLGKGKQQARRQTFGRVNVAVTDYCKQILY